MSTIRHALSIAARAVAGIFAPADMGALAYDRHATACTLREQQSPVG